MELVVVVAVTAILAGAMGAFTSRAMEGFRDLGRRATLVDVTEGAVRRTARDVRRALPNSVRVNGGGRALELLHAAGGGRYRRRSGINPGPVAHVTPTDWLSFATAGDAQFNVLGRFRALAFTYGAPLPAGTRVAIYTTGATLYADAASDANPGVVSPSTTSVTILADADEDQILLSAPFRFRLESPRQRLYVVDTPVTYLCDLASQTLTRYWGYPIGLAQPTIPTIPPLSGAASALVANRITDCGFTYQAGTSQRGALVTIEMQLSQAGEQTRLLQQVHVENVP